MGRLFKSLQLTILSFATAHLVILGWDAIERGGIENFLVGHIMDMEMVSPAINEYLNVVWISGLIIGGVWSFWWFYLKIRQNEQA